MQYVPENSRYPSQLADMLIYGTEIIHAESGDTMNRKPIHIALITLFALGSISLTGCETWKGLGKDVSNLGDDIQGDKSSDAKTEESEDEN